MLRIHDLQLRAKICAKNSLALSSTVMLRALVQLWVSGHDTSPNIVDLLYQSLQGCGREKQGVPVFYFSLRLPSFHGETGLKVTHLALKWTGTKRFLLYVKKENKTDASCGPRVSLKTKTCILYFYLILLWF